MDPKKEIIDQFEQLRLKFTSYSDQWKTSSKLNIKSITKKEYQWLLNQLMNFYDEIIQNKDNIRLIFQAKLDLLCWNMWIERISLVIKCPIDKNHLGENYQTILQNLYSTLLDDLRNSYYCFRHVYEVVMNYENDPILNHFQSNIWNFMGDLKKFKLSLNKKFNVFKENINIEENNQKDANDAIRFFNYALNNNTKKSRVYSNWGYVYREFLEDHMNSAYCFIRAWACVDNDLNKIKDNLEKDFNLIRKLKESKAYIVNENIDEISYLKYDIEYLQPLFYRIIGIWFTKINIDETEESFKNFQIIFTRILRNYQVVPEQYIINYEINGHIEQMLYLCIFTVHNNINNLQGYTNEYERIIWNKDKKPLFSFGVYNHKLWQEIDITNLKPIVKQSLNFISIFTKIVCCNWRKDNWNIVEKYWLILFYWLSLNYDLYLIIIDEEDKKYLKFLNFYYQNNPDMKKYFMPQTEFSLNIIKNDVNNLILPIEATFLDFIPMDRFFKWNPKNGVFRAEDTKEISLINQMVLIHFLDTFQLTPLNSEEIKVQFLNIKTVNIPWKEITNQNESNMFYNEIRDTIKGNLIKMPSSAITKKAKHLIVIDASNVAMRHGDGEAFSTKGIQIVMDYFTKNGHKVISFLPDYLFKQKDPNSALNKKRPIPDNIEYLKDLVQKGLVVKSPPQDYDDSYCIQYAKQNDAFVISNDMFRDYIEKSGDNKERETKKMWQKEKCISYTFNKDEFIPNPDANFFEQYKIEEYNQNHKS